MKTADKTSSLCKAVATILMEKRLAAGLSMTEMALAASLTRQMVGFVEKGTRVPSLDTFARLAIALKTSPSALLGEAEKRCSF